MILDLFKKNRKVRLSAVNDLGTETTSMEFDAVLRENHKSVITLTTHPLEDGSTVADSAVTHAKEITLDVMISNDPYSLTEQFLLMGGFAIKNLLSTGSPFDVDRSVEGYAALKELQANITILKVQTHIDIYDNMVLTSITAPRSNRTTASLTSTLTFKELRRVSASYDELKEPETIAETATEKAKGTKTAETADAATEQKIDEKVESSFWFRGNEKLKAYYDK